MISSGEIPLIRDSIVGAMVRCHKAQEPTKHQVEERSKHGGDTVMLGNAQPWTISAGCLIEFLYPTGPLPMLLEGGRPRRSGTSP